MNSNDHAESIRQTLQTLDADSESYAVDFVDRLLEAAVHVGVSDLHFQPIAATLEIRWRLDGVLQHVGAFPVGQATDVVARLKVLARLLTYRIEVPQEGRLTIDDQDVEMRLSTFPTLHGERAVVRIFAGGGRLTELQQLGFPDPQLEELRTLLAETSGALLLCGPAGSGKTTTAYACLREVLAASRGQRSVLSIEDPIESAVEGVAQSQVNEQAGFSLEIGLRSLVRQDPEVILVGEIRDRSTAEAVIGASLTGHLVITTFHAGDCVGGLSRLLEMGIEPYLVRSGVLAWISQRLLRRLCSCAEWTDEVADPLADAIPRVREPRGCGVCLHVGYRERLLLSETLDMHDDRLKDAILRRADRAGLLAAALEAGLQPLRERAREAVASGQTSLAEVRRVFGYRDDNRGLLGLD